MGDRRAFLKSAAAASVAAAAGCGPGDPGRNGPVTTTALSPDRDLDPDTLAAVAEVVLPSELGPSGRERAIQAFRDWLVAYEPVAELDHGYGTSEIAYGPPDPAPGWRAQLQALDLEARRRHDAPFTELEDRLREGLLRSHLSAEDGGLASPLGAGHVAIALMAHWFSSPGATDLCYGRRIGPATCRTLEGTGSEPPRIP